MRNATRYQTPRTLLTWSTLQEWLACARRIEHRRYSRLLHEQARLHLTALPASIVYACSDRETLACCADLMRHGLFSQPPRGQRRGAPQTALIVALSNRLRQLDRIEDHASIGLSHNSKILAENSMNLLPEQRNNIAQTELSKPAH